MSDSQYPDPAPALASRPNGLALSSYQEPALLRYFRLLWSHRLLLAVSSLLPAVAAALLLSLWPRRYTATLVYERPLAEREYSVLLRRFSSRENLDKIIDRLQEKGLADYARRLSEAQTEESFDRLVHFEVAPIYPKRLQTTDPATSERISTFQARLLSVRATGHSAQEVSAVSAVLMDNLENVLPLYDIRNSLKDAIQQFRVRAAEIEDTRFLLQLDRQKEEAKLKKLQGLQGVVPETGTGDVVLQFTDVQNSREFLPLSYQIRAVQSKIIDLEETLRSNNEKYNYYVQVLDLDERLLRQVEDSLLTDYTVPQFLAFLGEQLLAGQDEAVCDYLKSYLRKTENLVQVNTRAGEKPVVYPVAKHVVRGGALTLAVFLMVGALVAVVLEHRRERDRRPPAKCG
jgi:hypothetical protein